MATVIGRKRVARLMRGMGLAARRRFRRTTDSRHAFPVAPNLLGRDFTAAAPDRVWLADLTYIWTAEGWLYLAAVAAALNGRPGKTLNWSTPAEALDEALQTAQRGVATTG